MSRRRDVVLACLSAAALVAASSAARSADALDEAAVEHMFDVAFGATLTSDYLYRGITQTDHGAALQGYIEPSIGIFYGGVWASNVRFGGDSDVEVDLYAGIRPEFDVFSFDFGYLHWFYLNDPGSDGGELHATVEATVHDPLTLGAGFYFNPADSSTYVEGSADFAFSDNFGVSGAVGHVGGDVPYLTWNAGIYYLIGDWATLDLRYSDTNLSNADCFAITDLSGNECDGRLMASLSIDLSLSGLSGGDE
jgi:uncharacterized protein (TIGR02001 family)